MVQWIDEIWFTFMELKRTSVDFMSINFFALKSLLIRMNKGMCARVRRNITGTPLIGALLFYISEQTFVKDIFSSFFINKKVWFLKLDFKNDKNTELLQQLVKKTTQYKKVNWMNQINDKLKREELINYS